MKKLVVLLLLVLPWMASVQAQTHPCNPQWHPWQPAGQWSEGRVEYAFQSAECTAQGICGFPIIAIKHTFPQAASISVTLEGLDCQGKLVQSGAATGFKELPANQEYKSSGSAHPFRQITSVVRVEVSFKVNDDLYIALYDRDRGIDRLTINGRTRKEIAEEQAEKERILEEKENARKLREQEKQERDEEQRREAARAEAAEKERQAQAKRDDKISEQRVAAAAESPHTREMRQRAEVQQQKDVAEKQATDATIAGFGDILKLAINNDEDLRPYEKAAFYAQLNVGLSGQFIPVVSNSTNNAYNKSTNTTVKITQSSARTTGSIGPYLGFLLAVRNSKLLSFQASPYYSFGFNDGYHQSYGVGLTTALGHRFKIQGKGEYFNRSGSMRKDNATAGLDETSTTNYDCSAFRYGLGGRWAPGDGDMVLEFTAYRDKLSFLQNSSARIYSYEAKIMTPTFLCIAFNYGWNYPVAGQLLFANDYDDTSQNLSTISLYLPFTLIFKK